MLDFLSNTQLSSGSRFIGATKVLYQRAGVIRVFLGVCSGSFRFGVLLDVI
jgi:hypothetical protein